MSVILENRHVADNVYYMRVEEQNPDVRPGQFYMLKLDYPLLGRPISVCETGKDWVAFAYAVVGEGTKRMSGLKPGGEISMTGAFGNGFPVDEINKYKRIAIVSGGLGIAPFVELVKHLSGDIRSFCGFAERSYFADRLPNVTVATDSGNEGYHGFATDCFEPSDFDIVLACGPTPMIKTLIGKCGRVPALVSMEARMACGVGACLVCTCQTVYGYKRCCADGPVFWAKDVIL